MNTIYINSINTSFQILCSYQHYSFQILCSYQHYSFQILYSYQHYSFQILCSYQHYSFQMLCSYCVKCCNYSFDMISCLQNSLRNFYLLLRCFSISVSWTTIISQYKNVLYKQTYFQGHTLGRVWFIILTWSVFLSV